MKVISEAKRKAVQIVFEDFGTASSEEELYDAIEAMLSTGNYDLSDDFILPYGAIPMYDALDFFSKDILIGIAEDITHYLESPSENSRKALALSFVSRHNLESEYLDSYHKIFKLGAEVTDCVNLLSTFEDMDNLDVTKEILTIEEKLGA